MKKTYGYIFILLILLGIGAVTIFKNIKAESQKEKSSFAVKNVHDITKIVLKDKEGNTMLLTKADGHWILNENFKARKQYVKELLDVITNIYAEKPLAKAAQQNAIKQMSIKSTRVEVYTNNQKKPKKIYYVGGVSPSKTGTNMILEIDGKPTEKVYEVKLPGFKGFVTDRFYIDENLWRDMSLFDLLPNEIAEVQLNYLQEDSAQSYKLMQENGNFKLLKGEEKLENDTLYEQVIASYLMNFKQKTVETYVPKEWDLDTIYQKYKFAHLEIKDIHDEVYQVEIFMKPTDPKSKRQFEDSGDKVLYDVDRYFALVNNQQDWAVIQTYTFDPILEKADNFIKK
jgi:hypothetical protein